MGIDLLANFTSSACCFVSFAISYDILFNLSYISAIVVQIICWSRDKIRKTWLKSERLCRLHMQKLQACEIQLDAKHFACRFFAVKCFVLRTGEQNFVTFNSFLQIRRQEQLKIAWLRWGGKIKSLEDFTGISFWQEGLVETPNF